MPAKTALVNTLHKLHPLPADLRSYILENSSVEEVPKRTVLLRTGEVCQYAYFVVQGLARVFVEHGINNAIGEKIKDDESTTRFSPAGGLLMAPISFFTQTPSLEAIETCDLLLISYQELEEFYEQVPNMNRLVRLILQERYAHAHDIIGSFVLDTPEERYLNFQRRYQQIANRLPQKDIASYIGVTPQSLSRMVKRLQARDQQQHNDVRVQSNHVITPG